MTETREPEQLNTTKVPGTLMNLTTMHCKHF